MDIVFWKLLSISEDDLYTGYSEPARGESISIKKGVIRDE
jgi:hypothetical protein